MGEGDFIVCLEGRDVRFIRLVFGGAGLFVRFVFFLSLNRGCLFGLVCV